MSLPLPKRSCSDWRAPSHSPCALENTGGDGDSARARRDTHSPRARARTQAARATRARVCLCVCGCLQVLQLHSFSVSSTDVLRQSLRALCTMVRTPIRIAHAKSCSGARAPCSTAGTGD